MAYYWKWAMPVNADIAGNFLKELEQKNGELTPEIVLEASRDKNAVLHNCFEWDDTKAAESYRLQQAGYIIRNITVEIEKSDAEPQIVRALVNISDEATKSKGRYVNFEIAMQNETYKEQVLKNALYELQTFKKKFQVYKELANVIAAIDEFENLMSKKENSK